MRTYLSKNWRAFLLSRIIMMGLLYSSPVQGEVKDCSELSNTCEYYTCLEAQRDCGRFGYPRGFGQKYCLRFEEKKANFSKEGLAFIERTRNCLIEKLESHDLGMSCRKLKKQSFKDHIPCYIEGGYCDLPKSDRKELYKVVWPSLWRGKVIRAGLKIKKHCRQESKNFSQESNP